MGARGVRLRRDRRGALHQPVGPRLPAGVPAAGRVARGVCRARRCTPTRPRPRRACSATSATSCGLVQPAVHIGSFDRAEPHLSRAAARPVQTAAADDPPASRRRGRHHLLPVAARGRRAGGGACRRRHSRAALPRGARRRDAPQEPGRLPQRRGRRDGGHRRLRHGHRSVGRPLCRPRRRPAVARAVSAGGRPRRPRRAAGRVRAGDLARRLRALAQPARIRRPVDRQRADAAARHGAVCRGDQLPASGAGRLLRAGPRRRARAARATGAWPSSSAPTSRRCWHRRSCRRSRAPDNAGASATSSPCSAASRPRRSPRAATTRSACSACCARCRPPSCAATSTSSRRAAFSRAPAINTRRCRSARPAPSCCAGRPSACCSASLGR